MTMSEFTNLQINNITINDINTPIELTYERCQGLEKDIFSYLESSKLLTAYTTICKLGPSCLIFGPSPKILEDIKTFIINLTNEKLIELATQHYNNYVIYDISVFEIKKRMNIETSEPKNTRVKNETVEPKKKRIDKSYIKTGGNKSGRDLYIINLQESKNIKRKASKEEKTPKKKSIPKALRKKVWEKEIGDTLNGNCYVCDRSIQFDQFECGHIIAEINNGPTHIDNLKVLCKPCNNSCYTTDLEVFKNSIISKTQPIENEVKNRPSFLPNTHTLSQPKSDFDIQREMFKLRF
jgi:hypothetical protein